MTSGRYVLDRDRHPAPVFGYGDDDADDDVEAT